MGLGFRVWGFRVFGFRVGVGVLVVFLGGLSPPLPAVKQHLSDLALPGSQKYLGNCIPD